MTEPTNTEQYITEVSDALEMLGRGYDQPSVIIEPPRTVTARRDGRMVEVEEPAWVKFSTDFKKELKLLDVYSLKVFVYIGLSVNWQTGTAWPGIRKIALDTGIDKDTVVKATTELEEKGFLTIQKREGNSNIYKPVRYISIGTVPPEGTLPSDKNGELSLEKPGLSPAQPLNGHNKNNKSQQENGFSISKPTARADRTDAEQAILDEMKMAALLNTLSPKAIQDAVRDHFRLTPRWTNKYESRWMEWAMLDDPENSKTPVTPEQIKVAAKLWATDKRFNWAVPTLKGIQEHWLELTATETNSTTERMHYL